MEALTTFELTEKAAKSMMDRDTPYKNYKDIGLEMLPFKEFLIICPAIAMFTSKYDKELLTIAKNREEYNYLVGIRNAFVGEELKIYVKIEDDGICIDWNIMDCCVSLKYRSKDEIFFSEEKDRNVDEVSQAIWTSYYLIDGVTSCYLNPKIIKEKTETKASKNKYKHLKRYKSPSKKYIYQTKYIIKSDPSYVAEAMADFEKERQKRHYKRHSESWMVKGHIRHIKDKSGNVKEILVKPYVKGKGKKENVNYRITSYSPNISNQI